MTKIGYSAVLNGSEVHSWSGRPALFEYRNPGLVFRFKASRLKSTTKGLDGNTYQIVERHKVDPPTRFHEAGTKTISFDGTKVVVDPNWQVNKTLDEIKTERKRQLRDIALDRLRNTDWRVLLAFETGGTVPAAVATRRANIRNRLVEMENEIDALTTVEEIDAYVDSNWPEA